VRVLANYRPRHARNLLIFHASIGQSDVHEFLTAARRAARPRVPQRHSRRVFRTVRSGDSPSCSRSGAKRSQACAHGSCARYADSHYKRARAGSDGLQRRSAWCQHRRQPAPALERWRRGNRRCGTWPRSSGRSCCRSVKLNAAQAAGLPRADDARRRDVPLDGRVADARRASTAFERYNARDPRTGAAAEPRRRTCRRRGRRGRPGRDVPVGRMSS